jgi:hypothetical protein
MNRKDLKKIALLTVSLYGIAFVVFNASQHASVWLLPSVTPRQVPTLVVIVIAAAISIALSRLLRITVRRGR